MAILMIVPAPQTRADGHHNKWVQMTLPSDSLLLFKEADALETLNSLA
jgi:hypothetical protein